MMTIMLLVSLAFAQDDAPIVHVKPGDTFRPSVPYFALPEPRYDRCLQAASLLPKVEEELEATRRRSIDAIDMAREAITTLQGELETCGGQVGALTVQKEQDRREIKSLKQQKAVLIGTTATATVLAILGTGLAISRR